MAFKLRLRRRMGPHIRVGRWLRVPVDAVNMAHVRANLMMRNPEFWLRYENNEPTEDLEPMIKLYRGGEDGDRYVWLPRHFHPDIVRDDLPVVEEKVDFPRMPEIRATVKPRNRIQERAMAAFAEGQDGILCLAPGIGKTLTSLMIAAEGGRFPLLVVVHTTALLDQWKKEIARAYAISENCIGIIRGNRCEYKNKLVSIAMLQSLSKRTYPEEFYKHWRLVVFDEVHRAGSYTWSSVVHKFYGQRIGLTATPDRPDGMDKAFRVHIGKIRYKYTKQPLGAEFFFVHTGIKFHPPAVRNPIRRWAIVMSKIGKNEDRNWLIGQFLQKAQAEGRRIIVLGERVATLKHLYSHYPGKDKSLFIAATPPEKRREALQKKAIFATSSMAKEGLDVPELDTLFITIPFSGLGRLEQSVGRILRTCEGKKTPRVYVFVDNHSTVARNAAGQKAWAESKNYPITEIYKGEYADYILRERP